MQTGAESKYYDANGLVYDPLFAEAKSYSGNYGVQYAVYKLSPVLHVKL